MALGQADFTQLFTSTLQKYEKQLVDNVLLEHPTLELFKSSAKSLTGRGLVIPVRAADLDATRYESTTDPAAVGSAPFQTSVSTDIMGSAVYDWSETIITPFRLRHRDVLQNSGPEQIVNLVQEYVKAASADHGDFITAALHDTAANYAAAVTAGKSPLLPMDAIFGNAASDAASSVVVGGIDPALAGKSYWQATRLSIPTSGAGSLDIVAAFRKVVNEVYRASRKRPTHVICGFDVYEEFEVELQSKGQYTNPGGTGQTRFSEIKFGDLTLRLDPDCQDDRAYFIHQPSLRFAYCAGEFMKTFPAQPLEGTLDTVVPMASSLVFGVAERRANGLLIRA
jgi:hypothetical protein